MRFIDGFMNIKMIENSVFYTTVWETKVGMVCVLPFDNGGGVYRLKTVICISLRHKTGKGWTKRVCPENVSLNHKIIFEFKNTTQDILFL